MMEDVLIHDVWSEEIFNLSKIKNKNLKKIIIYAAPEWEIGGHFFDRDFIKKLEILLVYRNIELVVIFGNADNKFYENYDAIPKINTKVISWSMFFLYFTYNSLNFTKIYDEKKHSLDKLFICLNDKPHKHRCELIDKLFKEKLNDYGYFSWVSTTEETKEWVDYKFKYWEPKQTILDKNYAKTLDSFLNIPNEYFKTLINVIPESTIATPFLTEKTFTAILLKKPFIILGAKKIHKTLAEHGFLLYDEIFDYSFDEFNKYEDRIDGILQNLNKLKNENYENIWKKINPKVEYNKKRIQDIIRNEDYIPEEIKKIKDVLNNTGKPHMCW